jgi:thiol-disulfide isomerase/thioredoxin
MKLFFSSLLACSAICSFSVYQGPAASGNKSPKVNISGKIIHPIGNKVYIHYYKDMISYDQGVADSATLDAEGNFSMRFKWQESGYAEIFHGVEMSRLYLIPGDSLQVSLDTREFDETIHYEGRGSEVNNYMAAQTLNGGIKRPSVVYKLSESQYIHLLDSLEKKDLLFLDSWFSPVQAKNREISEFINLEKAKAKYARIADLNSYPVMYTYYNSLKEQVKLSDSYHELMKKLPLEDPAADKSHVYLNFRYEQMDREVGKLQKLDTLKKFYELQETYIAEHFTGILKEYAETKSIYNMLIYHNDVKNGKRRIKYFKTYAQNARYKELLDETLADISRLMPGNAAPDFTLTDINGKKVSLKDFKGKVVYLDIWASWCGPCLMEIPAAKKLHEEMKDRNIVFLCVSVDDDEEAWKKTVRRDEIKGIQLISKGGFSSEIARAYLVKGIPHYVIIDKKGKIVSNNAQRPSGGVKAELEKVLN